MQKKTNFDPRCTKMVNPIVQAYLDKQETKTRPIGDRQLVVNWVLGTLLALNLVVVSLVAWSMRNSIIPEFASSDHALTMHDAMARINALDTNLQQMRMSIEYHKNAYYKLEQEHETFKFAVSRVLPMENPKEVLSHYTSEPTSAVKIPNESASESLVQNMQLQSAREAVLAAQQSPGGRN